MDMGSILLYGGLALVLFIIIRKLFGGKNDTVQSDEPTLDLSKRMNMTQSQVEKHLNALKKQVG